MKEWFHHEAVSSINVVQVKCICWPKGDGSKGKGKYHSIVFQFMLNYSWKIMSVTPDKFGYRNKIHIAHIHPTLQKYCTDWYKELIWHTLALIVRSHT